MRATMPSLVRPTLKPRRLARAALGLSALLALSTAAWPIERVTLTNGFSIDCHHHADIEGRTRLYTDPSENSFLDVAPERILTVESLPAAAAAPAQMASAPLPSQTQWKALPPPAANNQLNTGDLHEILSDAGQTHNLDVDLLASVVAAESGGHARAVSRAGARGLMQLMPSTARQLGVDNSFEPRQNVNGGSAYLDALLKRYHENLALALAAYNAGPAVVDRCHCVPNNGETRQYVARVIHTFNRRVTARRAEQRRAAPVEQAKNRP